MSSPGHQQQLYEELLHKYEEINPNEIQTIIIKNDGDRIKCLEALNHLSDQYLYNPAPTPPDYRQAQRERHPSSESTGSQGNAAEASAVLIHSQPYISQHHVYVHPADPPAVCPIQPPSYRPPFPQQNGPPPPVPPPTYRDKMDHHPTLSRPAPPPPPSAHHQPKSTGFQTVDGKVVTVTVGKPMDNRGAAARANEPNRIAHNAAGVPYWVSEPQYRPPENPREPQYLPPHPATNQPQSGYMGQQMVNYPPQTSQYNDPQMWQNLAPHNQQAPPQPVVKPSHFPGSFPSHTGSPVQSPQRQHTTQSPITPPRTLNLYDGRNQAGVPGNNHIGSPNTPLPSIAAGQVSYYRPPYTSPTSYTGVPSNNNPPPVYQTRMDMQLGGAEGYYPPQRQRLHQQTSNPSSSSPSTPPTPYGNYHPPYHATPPPPAQSYPPQQPMYPQSSWPPPPSSAAPQAWHTEAGVGGGDGMLASPPPPSDASGGGVNAGPGGDIHQPRQRAGSMEDTQYIYSLLQYQRQQRDRLHSDLEGSVKHLGMLKQSIVALDERRLSRQRSRDTITPEDIGKMRDENKRLQVAIQLLARQIDAINSSGDTLLGWTQDSSTSSSSGAASSSGATPSSVYPSQGQQNFYHNISPGPNRSFSSMEQDLLRSALSGQPVTYSTPVVCTSPPRPSRDPPSRPSQAAGPPPSRPPPPAPPSSTAGARTPSSSSIPGLAAGGGTGEEDGEPKWACSACTFDNHCALEICEVCEMPRCGNENNNSTRQLQEHGHHYGPPPSYDTVDASTASS